MAGSVPTPKNTIVFSLRFLFTNFRAYIRHKSYARQLCFMPPIYLKLFRNTYYYFFKINFNPALNWLSQKKFDGYVIDKSGMSK
jgi:hypothetical protein